VSKEKEVLVQALFYVDGVDPGAADLPDLLRNKFQTEIDNDKIFFSICIPGENPKINIKDLAIQNNYLSQQIKFWQIKFIPKSNRTKCPKNVITSLILNLRPR
jgi:hypothetical protein